MEHEQLKGEMIACNFMNDKGINQGTSGVRVDSGLLNTPSGIPHAEVVPEDIAMMHIDATHHGHRKPSTEWRFHRDIIEKKPEVGTVIHLHSRFSTSLSMLRCEIPAMHYMIAATGSPTIPCVPYVTWGTPELAALAVEVETPAAQYWLALQAGVPLVLPGEETARVIEWFKSYGQEQDPDHLPSCC